LGFTVVTVQASQCIFIAASSAFAGTRDRSGS